MWMWSLQWSPEGVQLRPVCSLLGSVSSPQHWLSSRCCTPYWTSFPSRLYVPALQCIIWTVQLLTCCCKTLPAHAQYTETAHLCDLTNRQPALVLSTVWCFNNAINISGWGGGLECGKWKNRGIGSRDKKIIYLLPPEKQDAMYVIYIYKRNLTPWSESATELYRPSDRRLSAKWLPTFADRGCHVVSVTDLYGRILGFLDRSRYFSIK
jgi:hypothetical protein